MKRVVWWGGSITAELRAMQSGRVDGQGARVAAWPAEASGGDVRRAEGRRGPAVPIVCDVTDATSLPARRGEAPTRSGGGSTA